MKSKLGLDPLRQQLLETALAGKEDYDVWESEVLRLFKDLHTSDPLMRKPMNEQRPPLLQRFLAQAGSTSTGSRSSYPSSMASSSGRSFRSGVSSSRPPFKKQFPPRQSHVTELEEEQVEEEGEPDEEGSPDRGPRAFSWRRCFKTEAEVLATEIEEAENEGIDTEFLNELESGVEQAAESLITMREARESLQRSAKIADTESRRLPIAPQRPRSMETRSTPANRAANTHAGIAMNMDTGWRPSVWKAWSRPWKKEGR